MRARKFVPILIAAALWSCADSTPPSGTEIDLVLTQVDGKPLPFTVGILATGAATTVVNSGTLVGNDIGPDCKITLVIASGAPIVVSVFPCTINQGDVIDYPMDLGNNTGAHLYRFK